MRPLQAAAIVLPGGSVSEKTRVPGSRVLGQTGPGVWRSGAGMWIVGLAPAAHGANRTGRVFTGDSSGKWRFRALCRTGFSNNESSESRDDGLRLRERLHLCGGSLPPPANKPLPEEISSAPAFWTVSSSC